MAVNRSVGQQGSHAVSAAEAQLARVAGEGSTRHSYLSLLLEASGRHSGRDLADAVHLLCSLHGRYPGLIELALQRCSKGPIQDWLARASEGFERERLYLVRLTSAVGPLPSTPGAAETEASLVSARHALETLAMSERKGCALGAATALVGDWWPVRRLLDRAATRVGIDPTARVWGCRTRGAAADRSAGRSLSSRSPDREAVATPSSRTGLTLLRGATLSNSQAAPATMSKTAAAASVSLNRAGNVIHRVGARTDLRSRSGSNTKRGVALLSIRPAARDPARSRAREKPDARRTVSRRRGESR